MSDRLLLKTWLSMTVKLLLCALRRTAIDVFLPFGALKGPSGDGASRLRQRVPVAAIGVETVIFALGDETAFAKLPQGRSRLTEAHEGEHLPKVLGRHMHVSATARLEIADRRPVGEAHQVREMIEHDCGADAVLRRHVRIEADLHVSASKRKYPVAIADTTGYFYIFPATRAEKAKLSGSAINLDADDTPSGDGLHVTRRLHISTMFVVR